MRRKVLLSSLSVGRCFTFAVEPGGSTEESGSDKATRTDPILKPEDAWKITDEGETTSVVSASGETKSFSSETKVVEIPRQGFDRLVDQA
jgi:hypothetical protein